MRYRYNVGSKGAAPSAQRVRYVLEGSVRKAVATFREMRRTQANARRAPLSLAAIYSDTGCQDDLRRKTEALLKPDPDYTLGRLIAFAAYRDRAESEPLIFPLRDAGLPEWRSFRLSTPRPLLGCHLSWHVPDPRRVP